MNRLFGVKKPKEEPKPAEPVPTLGEASERVSYFLKLSLNKSF